jgi:hypothetical protein
MGLGNFRIVIAHADRIVCICTLQHTKSRLLGVAKSAVKDYLGVSKYRLYFEATPDPSLRVCGRSYLPHSLSRSRS